MLSRSSPRCATTESSFEMIELTFQGPLKRGWWLPFLAQTRWWSKAIIDVHKHMMAVQIHSLTRVESGFRGSSMMMLVVVIIHLASSTSVMVAALKRLDALLTRQPCRSSLDFTCKLAGTPVLRHFFSIRQRSGHHQPIPTTCSPSS